MSKHFKIGQYVRFIGNDDDCQYLEDGECLYGIEGRICNMDGKKLLIKWNHRSNVHDWFYYNCYDIEIIGEPKIFNVGDTVKYIGVSHYGFGTVLQNKIGVIQEIYTADEDILDDPDGETLLAIIKWEDIEDIDETQYNPDLLELVKIAQPVYKKWYSTEGHKSIWDLAEEQYNAAKGG